MEAAARGVEGANVPRRRCAGPAGARAQACSEPDSRRSVRDRSPLPRSSEVASAGRRLADKVFLQSRADFVVRQRSAAISLCQTLLDFPYEPIVVIQQALD